MFDLHDTPIGKAKYTLAALSALSREEYKDVVEEFFALVCYAHYKENSIISVGVYDPGDLAQLELPFHATEQEVKKRFRELAKIHHPDTGGDALKFIALMKTYEKLIEK